MVGNFSSPPSSIRGRKVPRFIVADLIWKVKLKKSKLLGIFLKILFHKKALIQ